MGWIHNFENGAGLEINAKQGASGKTDGGRRLMKDDDIQLSEIVNGDN